MHNYRTPEGGGRLYDVSIRRTVETPQSHLEEFLNTVGDSLRGLVVVRNMKSLHLTIKESRSFRMCMRGSGIKPGEVPDLASELSDYLEQYREQPIVVNLNPDQPIRFYGRARNRLALNVAKNDQVRDEREKAVEFLESRFSKPLPHMRKINEHITFGDLEVGADIDPEAYDNPMLLFENIELPSQVALNGLWVFLNSEVIHPVDITD